ncbi:MAG: RNA polymerase sigma factor RpoD/SigA [Deferribacteraceae bacterium]|jgi:RNA polymerase primary sigma factor|nr:RNA polymerase sigma factor RpoD/SigA [Deferribacteraceae bacterium]
MKENVLSQENEVAFIPPMEIDREEFDSLELEDTEEEIIYEPVIVSESSLSYYMKRIANTTPLTKQEEQELGRRIASGDQEAFDQLVSANLKFVITVAYKFRNSGLPLSDIINQGNLGLLEAAKRYDPTRGVKFISYAVWWIRQYIVQGIAEQSGTVRLPIKQAGNLFKINAAKEKLNHEYGHEPSTEELASYLNMKSEDVIDIVRVSKQSLSLESPLKDGEDRTFLDFLDSGKESIEETLIKDNLKSVLTELVAELDPREIDIISLRFGLDDDEALTLDEVGKRFGVSRERVRQLESRALDKLRKKAIRKGLTN